MTNKDSEALATLFIVVWCAVVLNPRGPLRTTLKDCGLIKPKGKLALSAAGERILREFKREAK